MDFIKALLKFRCRNKSPQNFQLTNGKLIWKLVGCHLELKLELLHLLLKARIL